MYNFYQSDIRKTINKDVYHKPVGEIVLFEKPHQYIIREKKVWPLSLCWIQIIGVENLDNHSISKRKEELQSLVREHNPMFVQLGSVDILGTLTSQQLWDDIAVQEMKTTRENAQHWLMLKWFRLANKENLPPSTYIIDLAHTKEALEHNITKRHRALVKKAVKHGVMIKKASYDDRNAFFHVLENTGKQKWFGIVSRKSYDALLDRLEKNNAGLLYVAKINNAVAAGAIYITDRKHWTWVYLYGWSKKDFKNIWASHFLHVEICKILQAWWINFIDLLWWWPTWYPDHHLAWVGTFKEGFGWTKVDYLWSCDIVYRPVLYTLRKILRALHH